MYFIPPLNHPSKYYNLGFFHIIAETLDFWILIKVLIKPYGKKPLKFLFSLQNYMSNLNSSRNLSHYVNNISLLINNVK